jgi:hypothetical protein
LRTLPVWDESRTYEAGRLSAFLDGEGHLTQGAWAGMQLLITQAEGPLNDEIRELWETCGFRAPFKWLRHKARPHEKPVGVSGVLRTVDVLRALGTLRPSRLLRRFATSDVTRLTIKMFPRVEVQSIESSGDGPVVGLTTDPDHTLIADGIVGHNTNVWSRPLLIEAGQRAINRGLVTLREAGLIDELVHFAKTDDGRYEAQVGHDDRVMALLLALRSREENYLPRKAGPPIITEPDLRGVRVADVRDVSTDARRRLSRLLRDAKDGVRSWMQY